MALLVTKALTKSFGDNYAVNRVDFTVKAGEVLALIGSNGAGKTTLVNLVSGLHRPDSGQILFEGHDVTQQTSIGRIRAGIARSFQLVNLFDHLSCLDNVALSIFSRDGKTRRMATLASRDSAVWDEAHALLRRFGLDRHGSISAGTIAHGERKLLDVAVAYALKPKLLFLDEPTSGVSTREKAPIMDNLSAIVRSGGTTVVIIEHDMDIVFRYSERIVVMHQGTVLADGTPDEIRRNDEVTTTLLGTHPTGEAVAGSEIDAA
jgi:ABC-type branched-subunit amino acid transport system ATPase component